MTTKQIIEIAYKHCSTNYTGGFDTELLVIEYAQEEKGLSEDDAYNYYETSSAISNEDFNSFYMWYFLNKMSLPVFDHIKAMSNDAYFLGHPEWQEIVNDLPIIPTKEKRTNLSAIEVIDYITSEVDPFDNNMFIIKDQDDMIPFVAMIYMDELNVSNPDSKYTVEFIGNNVHIY